jgi:uncharacterized protein YbjT (DUF2867 family)
VARVLVTGGTGVLGSALVRVLAGQGHDVVGLSRRPPAHPADGVRYVHGDVQTGEGVEEEAARSDAVVHAVSGRHRPIRVEIEGTLTVAAASARAGAHLLYVSIVGIDANPFGYYKAKLQSERVVEASGQRWTILRATQFHDLVDTFLGFPVFPVTRHLRFQPVDVGDVSRRLAQLVAAGPSGRADDFGGPEVAPLRDLAAARRRITGRRARLVPVPVVGETLLEFDEGAHLCPDHRSGTRTWEEWLTATTEGVGQAG